MGVLYTVVARSRGVWFISSRTGCTAVGDPATSELSRCGVFHSSITYLTLLFLAVGIDPLLPFCSGERPS